MYCFCSTSKFSLQTPEKQWWVFGSSECAQFLLLSQRRQKSTLGTLDGAKDRCRAMPTWRWVRAPTITPKREENDPHDGERRKRKSQKRWNVHTHLISSLEEFPSIMQMMGIEENTTPVAQNYQKMSTQRRQEMLFSIVIRHHMEDMQHHQTHCSKFFNLHFVGLP